MAPSRGYLNMLQARPLSNKIRHVQRFSSFVRAATDPTSKTQIYISRSLDPYFNLSVEHYLLQKTPVESKVLFLYTDRPSIIIGRNQNPWVEVNLPAQRSHAPGIELVRRRSGGGTVFHDEGNVNYSVICPTALFDRDKHAQMVVRALSGLGVKAARVNERHDIVMDKNVLGGLVSFKISGSAYKLTRLRSLHHGTCLLSSPNLDIISNFLHSPAKPFIKARGVDSVSSRITNVGVSNGAFEEAVTAEFRSMYGEVETQILSDELRNVEEIADGQKELQSEDWIYGQTPQFTVALSNDSITNTGMGLTTISTDLTVRNGRIIDASCMIGKEQSMELLGLLDKKFHEVHDWKSVLSNAAIHLPQDAAGIDLLGGRLDEMLGVKDS